MTKRVTNMTEGSPFRLIFFFSLPLMVGGVFQQGYMIVDSIIVGRGVGVQALASLGAADWINWMMLWAIQGFAQGFSVQVAQAFGARDREAVRRTAAALVQLCGVIGAVLTLAGLLSIRPLLTLLRTEQAVYGGAQLYLRVMFLGTPAVLAYNVAAAVLRCMGDSRTPLAAMIVAAAVNIGLDLLFVLAFRWGILGAAVATILAQLAAFLYCLHIMRQTPALCLSRNDWTPDRALLGHLLGLGAPTALQNAVIAVGGLVVQFVLNGFGLVFVAGFSATNKLIGVLESTAIAFGHALTAYMGQNYGARRADRIDEGMRAVHMLSLFFSSVIAVVMIVFGRQIVGLFVSAGERGAAQMIEIAYRYLFTMSCPLFFLFLIHVYRSSLQGLGNVVIPMLSGVVELCMRILAALALPRLLGQDGLYYAEIAAWFGADIFMLTYYYTHIGAIKRSLRASGDTQ